MGCNTGEQISNASREVEESFWSGLLFLSQFAGYFLDDLRAQISEHAVDDAGNGGVRCGVGRHFRGATFCTGGNRLGGDLLSTGRFNGAIGVAGLAVATPGRPGGSGRGGDV